MFTQSQYMVQLQRERRQLAVHNQQLQKSQQLQKQKADILEEELKQKDKQVRDLEKEKQKLKDELEKAKLTIESYKQMLFQAHKHLENNQDQKQEQEKDTDSAERTTKTKNKNGQKTGHTGYGRKKPEIIDRQVVCFGALCPDCGNSLERSDNFHPHTVTDIPHFKDMKPVTTQYQIEYQWCTNCHKAVSAMPFGVIPGSRIGMNLFLMILIWRYQLRLLFKKISEILFMQYSISLSVGGLVGITKKARQFFGKRYDDLLIEIKGAPVKHADETTWGMDGLLYWAWIFLTEKSVYYTIEESRGKGVPERILKDAIGVLVRDGYAGYTKLPLIHQACFAHVYRKARDAKERKGASDEAKELFLKIQQLYGLLAEDIQKPFVKKDREDLFSAYREDLEKITAQAYQSQDAKRVQTYIKNLGNNLLTALLYENVPLTNNPAEQVARQIVIGRKISGGSRSKEGAKTHAVNMSIMQTILKQKLPLFATLESYLIQELPKSSL